MKIITSISFLCWAIVFLAVQTISPQYGWGDDRTRMYEKNGLSFHYPSDLKLMGPSSTMHIQQLLNQRLQGMGNTDVSVVALDVLLKLPSFRVMIAKERFVTTPTPGYLIKERRLFLEEAKKRGMLLSYGAIKERSIAGHSAIEFSDLDKGPQGYGSRVRILCGKDTWNFTFTGNSRSAYEQYQSHMTQILDSVILSESCSG